MSTIGDDLLRASGEVRADGRAFGPRIEALVVYNSNPVAVAPDSAKVARGFARDDLFTVVLEHFLTDTADHADYVLPATTQLEHLDVHTSYGHTYALINEPAIAPLGEARPNTEIFRALAARMGFDEPCFARRRRGAGADRLSPGGRRRRRLRRAARATAGSSCDIAEAPFADGGFPTPSGKCLIDAPGRRRSRLRRQLRIGAVEPRARAPLSAGDDLAAGAQLPQLELRQRHQPARDRGRAGARDLGRRRRGARHRLGAAGAHLQRPRQHRLQGGRRRARPAGRRQRPGRLVAEARPRRQATSTS